jgi:hypothetical protein
VRYEGAYNERGAQLKADAGANDFDPWDLVETSDGVIISTTTVTRECRLSDGEYVVEIKPAAGNYRLTRECGGVMSASTTIMKDDIVLVRSGFEAHCSQFGTPVRTKITWRAGGNSAEITETPSDEFYAP